MTAQTYAIPVRDMKEAERPRERLLRFGPDLLKNHELLAIILNTGYRHEGVLELSQRVIQEYGSKVMGIELLDHVIIGKDSFVSLKELGKLSG